MLTTVKNITIQGTCTVDGTTIERYTAVINQKDPGNMGISTTQLNKTLVKENRETCRSDRAEFEDLVYSIQDEMLAGSAEETTEGDTE